MNSRESKDRFAEARERMLKWDLTGRGITDAGVLKVMMEIRREEFVPAAYQSQAYADSPLPVGMGQTISQPYIVALMTQELRLNNFCEVLEIGTGSGYQTAILSKLAKKVYTIEKFAQLSDHYRGGAENAATFGRAACRGRFYSRACRFLRDSGTDGLRKEKGKNLRKSSVWLPVC
jgi:predicted O-methyltransferase YrrM